jgi:hypothetical protein
MFHVNERTVAKVNTATAGAAEQTSRRCRATDQRKCDGKRACLLLVFCMFFVMVDISAKLVGTIGLGLKE